jgi:hypothetical protein
MKYGFRVFLVSLFVFPYFIGWAQSVIKLYDFYPNELEKGAFGIRAELNSNSTALTATFQNKRLTGGFINDAEKDAMLSRANQTNSTGSMTEAAAFMSFKPSKILDAENSKFSFLFLLSDRRIQNAYFTDQMLDIFLNGNRSFAGQTAYMSPFYQTNIGYQSFRFMSNMEVNDKVNVGFGVSLINGEQLQNIDASTLNLFTSEFGDTLILEGMGTIIISDTSNVGFLKNNGIGGAFSGYINLNINIIPNLNIPAQLYFEVRDLGWVNWSSRTETYRFDTTYLFDGIEYENIFDDGSFVDDRPIEDRIEEVSELTVGSRNAMLPAEFQLRLRQEFEKYILELGTSYFLNSNFSAYIHGSAYRKLSDQLSLGLESNYGGYGRFDLGVGMNYQSEHVGLILGSRSMSGWVNPDKWAGQSFYFQMHWLW